MAVVIAGTVVHIPFPSRVQYKSLEADGLAVLRQIVTGDASGGNVLHTLRGQAGFLYILRSVSVELDEAGANCTECDVEVRLDAQWLADAAGQAQGDFFKVLSMASVEAIGASRRRVAGGSFPHELVDSGGMLLLGKIQRTGDHDIMSFSFQENTLNNVYTSYAVFDAYRTEALTVPGILDRLRAGFIR